MTLFDTFRSRWVIARLQCVSGPSSNGRTADFGSVNGGSNPPGPIGRGEVEAHERGVSATESQSCLCRAGRGSRLAHLIAVSSWTDIGEHIVEASAVCDVLQEFPGSIDVHR